MYQRTDNHREIVETSSNATYGPRENNEGKARNALIAMFHCKYIYHCFEDFHRKKKTFFK